jgi:hypothetical protein
LKFLQSPPGIARVFLDIDASKGRLTTPVAAIFPARFVELFMKLLRDEFTKVHLCLKCLKLH